MKIYASLLICVSCLAQSPSPAAIPAFETASIHPNPRVERQDIQLTPNTLILRNQPVFFLVEWAWDVTPAQIDPPWFHESCFDIVAKAPGTADETQMRLMLRTLLADRFGLKLHKEARTTQVYAMTLAKGGPKFHESETEGTFVIERNNPVVLNAHHARMSDLAQGISGELGRPVIDATGLTGRYEIHMDVSPYVAAANAADAGKLDVIGILFTGLQDLLGLKLDSRKESVDVVVIDHAEKLPTEN
jgi:uncharacterized protein (TIGR03435 family)